VILFFLQLSTRRVEIAGIASNANGLWMSPIGRNLTDSVDGLLKGKRYLIHDRDPSVTTEFLGDARRCGHYVGPRCRPVPRTEYERAGARSWRDRARVFRTGHLTGLLLRMSGSEKEG